jgi:hypothetical protein
VRISRKFLGLALLSGGTLLLAGCGGLSAAQTISPLDFLLPGILKTAPPQTNSPAVLIPPVQIASVR